MLLRRGSAPPNERPDACGVRRVMSPRRPPIVGSVASWSREMVVAAPVRFELNTGSIVPTTVTLSFKTGFTLNVRSVAAPRLTVMLSCVDGWNAAAAPPLTAGDTITVYGPPTRMFGMTKRPSARDTDSYDVP